MHNTKIYLVVVFYFYDPLISLGVRLTAIPRAGKGNKMAKFVNLTPHSVNIVREDGTLLDIPSEGIARCEQYETVVRVVDGIKITKQRFGEVVDLPNPVPGTIFIVSRIVATAVPNRTDVVCPGPLLRNNDGQPIGCKGLSIV